MTHDELLLQDYIQLHDGNLISGFPKNQPVEVIVHHTGGTDVDPLADTSNQSFDVVDAYHKQRWQGKTLSTFGHYIGYHFFIDKKGKKTQGRDYTDIGAHTIGENARSIGICLAGNFDATYPTPEQVETLKHLLLDLLTQYKNIHPDHIYPHRHFTVKTCYGKHISDDWARSLVAPQSVTPTPPSVPVSPPVTPTQNTFNLFAYLFTICKKLFGRS